MKSSSIASMLVLFAASASCASSNEPPPREPISMTKVTSETPARRPTPGPVTPAAPTRDPWRASPNDRVVGVTDADRTLAEKIEQRLAKDPALTDSGWSRVQIRVGSGRVRLTGEVPSVADSCDIEHAVREVEGVESVANDLHLPPKLE